uniref:Uncharacterized protein n=1 Tax=Helianthus annuus TaxID=4232 RepID=A0A251U2K2_HELAN
MENIRICKDVCMVGGRVRAPLALEIVLVPNNFEDTKTPAFVTSSLFSTASFSTDRNQEAEMYPKCADQKRKSQPVDYADKDLWTVSKREITSVRQLCDSSYMPSLSVFRKNKPCE